MSIPGLAPQPSDYTSFLEQTRRTLGDWSSRLVSVIAALPQQMHASRYVAVGVFTVANVIAFYAIRVFVSRLEPRPATDFSEMHEGAHQDAKPLQSFLCPILVGAAGYGVNTALAKATHYSIHPFVLTAIAVAMTSVYHFTRQPVAQSLPRPPSSNPQASSSSVSSPSVQYSATQSSLSSPSSSSSSVTPILPDSRASIIPPTPFSSPTSAEPSENTAPSSSTDRPSSFDSSEDCYNDWLSEWSGFEPAASSDTSNLVVNSLSDSDVESDQEEVQDPFDVDEDAVFPDEEHLNFQIESDSDVESDQDHFEDDEEELTTDHSLLSRSRSEEFLDEHDLLFPTQTQPQRSPQSSTASSPRVSPQHSSPSMISLDEAVVSGEEEPSPQKIQKYIEEDKLEEAMEATEKLAYGKRKMSYCSIARAYFSKNDLEKAIKILDDEVIRSESTNPIYREFARSCCLQSKYEDAIKCIGKISTSFGDSIMNEIFLEVANQQWEDGNCEKAEETAGYLKDKPGDSYENVCLSIGQVYIERGELDKAATTLGKIIYKTDERDKIFSELAKKYYDNNDLENAVKYNKHNTALGSAKDFYVQVALKHKGQGNDVAALNVLRTIANHGRLLDVKNSLIIRNLLDGNNFDLALEGIRQSSIRESFL